MCKGTIMERRCKCRNSHCTATGREPDEAGHTLGVEDVVVYDWRKHYRQTSRFNYNVMHPDCPSTTYDVHEHWAKDLC